LSVWSNLFTKNGLFPKSKQFGPIGLDIRSHSLNMVQVSWDSESRKTTIHVAISLPLPCSVEELLASPSQFKKIIADTLKNYHFVGKRCVSTLPTNHVKLKHINYTQQKNQDNNEAILSFLRELLGEKLESSVIDIIPIRAEYEKQLSRQAIVAIADRSDVEHYLGLLDRCGIDVDAIEVGPIAIRRLIVAMNPNEKQSKILTINVGQDSTYLTLIWGRRILLDRKVAFGTNTIVDAVVKELDISKAVANTLLDKYGFEQPANLTADQQNMAQVLHDIEIPIITILSMSIRDVLLYAASETRGGGIDSIYLLGAIRRWQGSDALLQKSLSVPVKVIDSLYGFELGNGLHGPDIKNDDLSGIAVATGMALRGLITNV